MHSSRDEYCRAMLAGERINMPVAYGNAIFCPNSPPVMALFSEETYQSMHGLEKVYDARVLTDPGIQLPMYSHKSVNALWVRRISESV